MNKSRKLSLLLAVGLATRALFGSGLASSEVVVSVVDQQLAFVDRGKVITRYPISTSKFGIGDSTGSYRTPLGTLFVSAKFGDRLPAGAVIKNRVSTGETIQANTPGRDAIVSRVV